MLQPTAILASNRSCDADQSPPFPARLGVVDPSSLVQCRQSRVPRHLQAVFLEANRGNEVYEAPPYKLANRTLFRNLRKLQNNTQRGGSSCHTVLLPNKAEAIGTTAPQQASEETTITAQEITSIPPAIHRACRVSPQAYYDAMIRSRGYSASRYMSLQTAYHNKPTPFQEASYHVHLIQLVRNHDVQGIKRIFKSGVVSANPCNRFGESLLHMVCRRGQATFLELMLQVGCQLQVTDDYGRTPLHDACWSARPCFDVVELILDVDRRMFQMADCRGASPLAYIPQKDWAVWLGFLESRKDEYWPPRDLKADGKEAPPELTLLPPNSRPIPNPQNALTVELATEVAAGRMTPEEAIAYHTKAAIIEKDSDSAESENELDDGGSDDDEDMDSECEDGSSDYDDSSDDGSTCDDDGEDELSVEDEILDEMMARITRTHHKRA